MNKKYIIAGLILGTILIYSFSTIIVNKKTEAVKNIITDKIENQIMIVSESATVLGNGSVSSDVDSIVPKCNYSDLTKYDTLLSSLDKGLSKSNIIELKSLFDRCGDNASNQRSVMALKLNQEVNNLDNLIFVSVELEDDKKLLDTLSKWKKLSELEIKIADLFSDLVFAQNEIINTLLGNVSSNVRSVEEIRMEAQSIRNNLTTVTEEASKLRAELI